MEFEPNSVHSLPQNPIMDDEHQRRTRNLKASIFDILNPSKTLTPQFKSLIEQRLPQFFPNFDTPSHPPYSSMIQRALEELNGKEGLTEEEISAFLKREYKNLPWGHESFLSHHLRKLCGNGDISCVDDQRYVLLNEGCVSRKMMRSTKKRKGRGGRLRRNQFTVKKLQRQCEQENQQIQVLEDTGDSRNQQLKMAEKKNEVSLQPQTGDKKPIPNNTYDSIMSELKDSVLEDLIAAHPSKTISDEFKSYIEQRLQELFYNLKVPTCPLYASETLQPVGIKQHKEKISRLEGDVQEPTVIEQEQSQAFESTTNSSVRSENLNHNYLIPSLKNICMKSVKKTKKFKELLLEFSELLQGLESNYENCGYTREAKRKKYQQKTQQVQTQTSHGKMVSNTKVIKGQNQHRKQEEKMMTNQSQPEEQMPESRSGIKLRIVFSKSSLPVVKEGNQEKRLQINTCERRGIVCSLMARQCCQPEISGVQTLAKSHSMRLHGDRHQHTDHSAMERSFGRKTDLDKSPPSSSADPGPQYEQQLPKHRGRGRPRRLKLDANIVPKILLFSNNHFCNEKQQQLEVKGMEDA